MKTQFKSMLLALACILAFEKAYSQVAINADGTDPDGSAMLDIQSATKGFLVPRLTSQQKGNIPGPATGLLIYQTDGAAGFYYNEGSPLNPSWVALSSSSSSLLWLRSSADHSTFLANPNDSVGIGRSWPTEKLDVKGNLDLDNFQPLILFREDSLEAGRIMHFGSPLNGYLQVQAWDGNNFETTGLVVESPAQHVGVGTTNPAFRLDVAGTTRTAGFILSSATGSGYILTSDENGVASWQLPASHLAGSGNPGYLAKYAAGDTLNNSVMFQNTSGNIGVGTSNPAEKLDVSGRLNMQDNIRMNGNWLSSDGTNEGVFVSSGGNVGIGTSSPLSKLTAAGMIQTTAGGVKFPDNTVQTTAATEYANQLEAASARWIIGMQIEGIMGPYMLEECDHCFKVIGLDWYLSNSYDSISGQLTNSFSQHHLLSIIKDIDSSTVELIRRLNAQEPFWMNFYFYEEPSYEGPGGPPYYKIRLENAQVVRLGHTVAYIHDNMYAHLDKVYFIYQQIQWEWFSPQDVLMDYWGGR